jgi:CAAX protease family protein
MRGSGKTGDSLANCFGHHVMLFTLKRAVPGSLAGLAVLALLGLVLRQLVPAPPPLGPLGEVIPLGLRVYALVLASDGLIHGFLMLTFRERYLKRHRELGDVFAGQSYGAIVAGALMAGLGEELVFRGLSTDPIYLGVSAVVFGLLHHIRRNLWPFTLWAMWQGALFGVALHYTGLLGVTMVAHFMHDTTGFLLFRHLRRRAVPVLP